MEPWERQPHESDRAFHAFVHYRDLGPGRSIDKAWVEHIEKCLRGPDGSQKRVRKIAPGRWSEWSMEKSWVSRAQAWDAELDRRKREAQAEEIEEMEKRHAQFARNALSVIGAITGLFGKRVQDDRLAEMEDDELAELVTKALRNAPEIADLERKSRGMPTEINEQRGTFQVTDKHEYEITQRIIADPEARELARRLYSRLDSEPEGSGQG